MTEIESIDISHDDTFNSVTFYMNDSGKFIYLKNNKVINYFSNYDDVNELSSLVQEHNKCARNETINGRYLLHYYERKSGGLAHAISKLSTYLRFVYKYKGSLVIPDNVHINIKNIINNIYTKVYYLKKKIKYTINNFFCSKYFYYMGDPDILKPGNKYPLIVYNNDVYWFRSAINRYIDFKMEKKKIFNKIFVGKFEGQSDPTGQIAKPRSLLGCIPKNMVEMFEGAGYVNIDPYRYNIHDIIYYIRHADKIILSCGTCAHLYVPYIKKNTIVYYMINVIAEMGINYNKEEKSDSHLVTNNNEYSDSSDIILRFINNYKICYYNYHPYFDAGARKDNVYTGEDMLDFLKE
jgi:hypothetical protein